VLCCAWRAPSPSARGWRLLALGAPRSDESNKPVPSFSIDDPRPPHRAPRRDTTRFQLLRAPPARHPPYKTPSAPRPCRLSRLSPSAQLQLLSSSTASHVHRRPGRRRPRRRSEITPRNRTTHRGAAASPTTSARSHQGGKVRLPISSFD
jgi:hypothetical protein